MANYIVDWKSGGVQGIPRKTSIVLPEKTKDSSSTSITLTGRGVNNWGEIQQENFIRLMENFASNTPPENPTIGQLWYNPAENILYINVDELTVTDIPLYHPQSPARWAQVWPSSNAYASVTEYNNIALDINRIIGTPSVFGGDADVANNQYGWGQTDLVPVYTSQNLLADGFDPLVYPPMFDNSAWAILLSRLRKALRHIGQSESLSSPVGFINDRRPMAPGNALANSYNNFPAQGSLPNIKAGWNGLGLATLQTYFNNTVSAINTLKTNRFSMAALSSQINQLVNATRITPWSSTLVHNMTFTFASENAAKAYFNAGGSFKFDWAHSGGADAINTSWTNFLLAHTGIHFDFKGMRRNGVYKMVSPAGTSTVGFYDLTTTFQDLYRRDRQFSTYENQYVAYETISDGGMRVEARKRTSGSSFIIDINVYFTETVAPGEVIVGTTTSIVSGLKASSSNTNQPGIAQPVATSGGSFTT
jgi:hypothetical protein